MNEEILRSEETAPEQDAPLTEETPVPEDAVAEPSAPETVPADEPLTSDITHRLAEEFFGLREEFPALHSPEQLPDAVLDMAVEQGIPLFDAYLRFLHEEEKRTRQEEERRRAAAARSAGSLLQGQMDAHPEQEAFLRAFRTALK